MKRERGSSASCEPKESSSTSSGGKIKQNLLPIYPGAIAKLAGRTSPTLKYEVCHRDFLATILATLKCKATEATSVVAGMANPADLRYCCPRSYAAMPRASGPHLRGAPQRTLSRSSVREATWMYLANARTVAAQDGIATHARSPEYFFFV